MAVKLPERFGKYTVSALLGRGAMGAVYKAFDPDIRRPVAIKTIRWDLTREGGPAASIAARFRNEAQAAGRLSHPGIVAVYEFGQSEDCAYIAMEFVEGCNLREYFARDTTFEEADVVSIMVQLLDALSHAHERKVWHRDIKPANLIVMNSGRLKIADFGIARIEASDITQTFPVMGTPGYIPPEMYRGEPVDHRADVFAAGAVLYQLLTGKPPFDGAAEQVMFKVCNEPPAPIEANEAGDLTRYDPVLRKALAKSPGQRYESALAFREAILETYEGQANPTVSQGTVIIASEKNPALQDAAGSASRSGSGTPWPQGWDPTTLGSVEHQLANVVGPMARVMVQRAANKCTDLNALLNMLANGLDSSDEKQAFLVGVTTGPTITYGSAGKAGHAAAKPAAKPAAAKVPADPAFVNSLMGQHHEALGAHELEHAAHVLAKHIGPLARVIVKRASDKTSDLQQFYKLVAEGVPNASDREAFLRDIHTRH